MPACSLLVQIADVPIRIETDDVLDGEELNSLFRYHRLRACQEAECTVVLKRQALFRVPREAEMVWQSLSHKGDCSGSRKGRHRVSRAPEVETFGVASCYRSRERNTYYYGSMQDRSWIYYQPEAKKIGCVLYQPSGREGSEARVSVSSAIPLLMHVISTVHGRVLLHGAAVAWAGKAYLLLGASGSGKSTLCTDLAQQGAAFMGDDLVMVYREEGVLKVGALLFQAKLFQDRADEKRAIDVPADMETAYCLSAPLAAVCTVHQSGEERSAKEARPADELLQRLIDASGGPGMQMDKQQWFDTLGSISEAIPYSVFHFGNRKALDIAVLTSPCV